MKNITQLEKVKVVGLNNDMPYAPNDKGEIHTNAMLFLLKNAILELNKRLDVLEFQIAESAGLIETEEGEE